MWNLERQPDAIYAFGDPTTFEERRRIVDFANRQRLPSAFGIEDFVAIGGLFSYGPDTADSTRRSARYIGRILKGAKPSELPLSTSLLARADQVIE